jgi:integrase
MDGTTGCGRSDGQQIPLDSGNVPVPRDWRLRKIEETGKLETAKRAKIKAGQVFRYAVLEGKAASDPTATLRKALKAPKGKHHAAITEPAKMGELLRAIDGFTGQYVTLAALKLAPLVFVRPGELRQAEWTEFDLDGAIWRIPGERMKMKAAHLVPLSHQAVAILRELQLLTGTGRYIFPGLRTASRPMSENTINAALRRLGYTGEEMTGHGFRSMAATRLNEMGWNADAIERQLAHAESNKVREAYTHAAQYLDERTRMMQAWADYLDALRAGGKVIAINRKVS